MCFKNGSKSISSRWLTTVDVANENLPFLVNFFIVFVAAVFPISFVSHKRL